MSENELFICLFASLLVVGFGFFGMVITIHPVNFK
jgi:hypothetical protein